MWAAISEERAADLAALRAWRATGHDGQLPRNFCAVCGARCGSEWQTSRWPGASHFFHPQHCCCSQEHLIQLIQSELVGWSPEEDWEWQLWTYPWKESNEADVASSSRGTHTGEIDVTGVTWLPQETRLVIPAVIERPIPVETEVRLVFA